MSECTMVGKPVWVDGDCVQQPSAPLFQNVLIAVSVVGRYKQHTGETLTMGNYQAWRSLRSQRLNPLAKCVARFPCVYICS